MLRIIWALSQTCPSLSEMKLIGIRDSGSVAWPASSRKTWVKCPTLWRHEPTVSWITSKRERQNNIHKKAQTVLYSYTMEKAGTGAGADNNPVIGRMTNILSCFGIQSQHFRDGLREKKQHWQSRCMQDDTFCRPSLTAESSVQNTQWFRPLPPSSYLLLPTGCIDSSQTCSVQESALMEADADEVCGTVGRCAHQNTAIGQKVVNLVVQFTNTRREGVG